MSVRCIMWNLPLTGSPYYNVRARGTLIVASWRLGGEICLQGSANTKIEFVACGMRASGIVSVTMLLDHEPPPVPTGTATYCLPLTAYVIGNPWTSVGMRGLV